MVRQMFHRVFSHIYIENGWMRVMHQLPLKSEWIQTHNTMKTPSHENRKCDLNKHFRQSERQPHTKTLDELLSTVDITLVLT